MSPPAIHALNIKSSNIILSCSPQQANSSINRILSAVSGVKNSVHCLEPSLTYLDIMPAEVLKFIAQATPLTDRQSLANALNWVNDHGSYIGKELRLSNFIIKNRAQEISSIDDFRRELREIQGLLTLDLSRGLKAIIGSILNFADRTSIGPAVIEFIALARSCSHRCPTLRNLITILDGEYNTDRLIENFRTFIYRRLETENNCLMVAVRYGITDELFLHDLEYHNLNRLSSEEIKQSQSPEEIAEKYGFYETGVLGLLEHTFVEYRAGVEVLKGSNVGDVAAKYKITTPQGRKRLTEYFDIATKIKAGGNCFQLAQQYNIDLRNETSRIAMEELSIKYAASSALLTVKNWRAVANRHGILTRRSRKKIAEYIHGVRAVKQAENGNVIRLRRSNPISYSSDPIPKSRMQRSIKE